MKRAYGGLKVERDQSDEKLRKKALENEGLRVLVKTLQMDRKMNLLLIVCFSICLLFSLCNVLSSLFSSGMFYWDHRLDLFGIKCLRKNGTFGIGCVGYPCEKLNKASIV